MGSEQPQIGHAELKKMYDYGFGRTLKGFRTTADAIAFQRRWRRLSEDYIRALYPRETEGRGDTDIDIIRLTVGLRIQQQGIQGLLDAFGGSARALERTLKAGLDAIGGPKRLGPSGAVISAGQLANDVLLDIYIFGTGPTGVPNFDDFIMYRYMKVFEYTMHKILLKKLMNGTYLND